MCSTILYYNGGEVAGDQINYAPSDRRYISFLGLKRSRKEINEDSTRTGETGTPGWIVALIILSRRTGEKKGACHRHRGQNNREKLCDKNGNGRENVASCMWKDAALRRRPTGSPVETRSAKSDGNMNEERDGKRGRWGMRPMRRWRGTEGDREK